jgi:predicted O-methyltransferase YrrM
MRLSGQIKLYRKLRFRKGFGVHSPFTFNLITKVIEEQAPYYAFDEIENFRERLTAGKNELIETQHRNYGALLFRLVRWFGCRSVLQIRGRNGIMSLYLASASSTCECTVIEDDTALTEASRRFAELKCLDNLHFVAGDCNKIFAQWNHEGKIFDLVFINQNGDAGLTRETLQKVQNHIGEKTVLVIDGIARNREMKVLWKELQNHSVTRITLDLMAAGIVFFDSKLNKQHYKSYFDYGRKQNLVGKEKRHWVERQGKVFRLLRRRKN